MIVATALVRLVGYQFQMKNTIHVPKSVFGTPISFLQSLGEGVVRINRGWEAVTRLAEQIEEECLAVRAVFRISAHNKTLGLAIIDNVSIIM